MNRFIRLMSYPPEPQVRVTAEPNLLLEAKASMNTGAMQETFRTARLLRLVFAILLLLASPEAAVAGMPSYSPNRWPAIKRIAAGAETTVFVFKSYPDYVLKIPHDPAH